MTRKEHREGIALTATVCEPLSVIRDFLAWHRSQGIGLFYLFFDDPHDPAAKLLEGAADVVAILCDDAHWQAAEGRPERVTGRQAYNANLAYGWAKTRANYLMHCDADEWLQVNTTVSEVFHEGAAHVIRAEPIELFETQEDDGDLDIVGRVALNNQENRAVFQAAFGRFTPFLNQGFLSHLAGKYAVRTGLDHVHIEIHAPTIRGKKMRVDPHPDLALWHFHAANRTDWIEKLDNRMTLGYQQSDVRKKERRRGLSETPATFQPMQNPAGRLLEWYDKNRDNPSEMHKLYEGICVFDGKKLALDDVGAIKARSIKIGDLRKHYASEFEDELADDFFAELTSTTD